MGATRRAWRAIERAQMKDAAKRVRQVRRAERAEAEALHDEAIRMAASFEEPSGLVQVDGSALYALRSELAGDGQ